MFTPQQFWEGGAGVRDQARIYLVMLGFCALLTLLHLAFYYYNPAQRANRYFALYALTGVLACVAAYYTSTFPFATYTSGVGVVIVANSLA
jgi:multisubunit Na+/H+ antiporter MnhB subunit